MIYYTLPLEDLNSCSQFALILLHTWVLVFIVFITLATWFWFVFFKLQRVVDVLLPPLNDIYSTTSFYYSFVVMIHVLAVFQAVYIAVLVMRQSLADVFLIDWEPPKLRGLYLHSRHQITIHIDTHRRR